MNKKEKLEVLCLLDGRGLDELLSEGTYDSVAQGICVNDGCEFVRNIEPDSHSGWCEECETNSVWSCLVLAGII